MPEQSKEVAVKTNSSTVSTRSEALDAKIVEKLKAGLSPDDIALKYDVDIEHVKELKKQVLPSAEAEIDNPRELIKKKLLEIIKGSDIAYAEFKLDPSLNNQINMTSFITKAVDLLDKLNAMFDPQDTAEKLVIDVMQDTLQSVLLLVENELKNAKEEFDQYMPDSTRELTQSMVDSTVKALGIKLLSIYHKKLELIEKLLDSDLKKFKPQDKADPKKKKRA